MALVYPGGAFVVFDASAVLRRRRMQVAGQAIASVRAGRVDANRIGTATVAFRAALRFAFVDICEGKKNQVNNVDNFSRSRNQKCFVMRPLIVPIVFPSK